MPGTYKMTELVGTSPVSFTEAVKAAVDVEGLGDDAAAYFDEE